MKCKRQKTSSCQTLTDMCQSWVGQLSRSLCCRPTTVMQHINGAKLLPADECYPRQNINAEQETEAEETLHYRALPYYSLSDCRFTVQLECWLEGYGV